MIVVVEIFLLFLVLSFFLVFDFSFVFEVFFIAYILRFWLVIFNFFCSNNCVEQNIYFDFVDDYHLSCRGQLLVV